MLNSNSGCARVGDGGRYRSLTGRVEWRYAFAASFCWSKRQARPAQPSPAAQAVERAAAHVPRRERLIVDNTVWVDLVERGFPPRNVVWFWKLDLDPGVSDLYPRGYREFGYVLSSDIMRTTAQAPVTRGAIEHSCLVVRFGRGETRVEVRRIFADERPKRCGAR